MKAKKSLGQNFLKSATALRSIILGGEISPKDIILEIGPGKGVLTEKLLEAAGQVIAVEKDRELFELLQERFKDEIKIKKLILIQGDILDLDPSAYGLMPSTYKLIANIPYNITGAILKKFLSGTYQPWLICVMVQKEVAERIMARNGKESLLSISVKAYGTPSMLGKVPSRYFSPAPKVDSAIISIKNISKKFFEENNLREEEFWRIVRLGFAHKRKKLSNNLKNVVFGSKKTVFDSLTDKRAEDLTLREWMMVVKSTEN